MVATAAPLKHMGRAQLRLLLAIAALLGLVGIAVYVPDKTPVTLKPLLAAAPASISTVTLARRDKPEVTLQREPAPASGKPTDSDVSSRNPGAAPLALWRMTAPLQAPANSTRALALAGLAAQIPERSYPVADADLDALGLARPAIRLRLDDALLEFGGNDPITGLRYVRLGDTVHLIPDTNSHHLRATAENFIDVRPLGPSARIRTLRLQELTVSRESTGPKWSPTSALTSGDDAAALLSRWENANATMVETFDLRQRWARPVHVTLEDEQVLRFVVARTPTAVYLGRQDLAIQYRLSIGTGAQLFEHSPR